MTLVFTTGLLRNLNHMYAGRNDESWVGLVVFMLSMALFSVAWVVATPFTLRHPRVVQRVGFALIGPVQRLFEHVDATPGEYTEKDISPYFWHNGHYPDSDEYRAMLATNFETYRLRIGGLVGNPVELGLADLRGLPSHEQITQHFCIQGWSGVAKWGGVRMETIIDLVKPRPEAKWVVFYSLGQGPNQGVYYDAHPIEQMRYHLTMLAYDMNGEPLSFTTAHPCGCATRSSSVSSRSSGLRRSSSWRPTRRSGVDTAATTRTTSFSDIANRSNPRADPRGDLGFKTRGIWLERTHERRNRWQSHTSLARLPSHPSAQPTTSTSPANCSTWRPRGRS